MTKILGLGIYCTYSVYIFCSVFQFLRGFVGCFYFRFFWLFGSVRTI